MKKGEITYAWSDIAEEFKGTLLIGNGGSIALSNNFSYASLYKFGVERNHITPEIKDVFNILSKTGDFERLLRRLWEADFINKKFNIAEVEQHKVRKPYTDVRRALINTVKDIHPNQKQLAEKLLRINKFSAKFSKIFTLNYDLTLSWATQVGYEGSLVSKSFNDGFSIKKADTKLNTFVYDGQIGQGDIGVYYLHGNLCLCQTKTIRDEKKLTPEDTSNSLLEELTEYWARNDVQPLFICEGISFDKLSAITNSHYLSAAYEQLKVDKNDSLTIYGWSMSKGDEHILDAIKHNSSYKRVAVSLYKADAKYLAHAKQALNRIGIESVSFFDAESLGCWVY